MTLFEDIEDNFRNLRDTALLHYKMRVGNWSTCTMPLKSSIDII